MNFFRLSSSHFRRRHHLQVRTLYDAVNTLRCPRDRGLDHAVERERHLKPLLNLKHLILSEPSKSLPLPVITQSSETLGIPFRPIEFIRKYPSIFQEFQPGALNIQPHIKLTPEVLSLHTEEDLLYQSVNYKQDIASRLLKLLMIGKINKIPIFVLDRLSWELGLPKNYAQIIIPEFPDYFRVISENKFGGNRKTLELVCWTDEFAVSEIEKKRGKDGKAQFLLQHSKEFEMDKKYKKWVDEWQKLPYISPYENATHLAAKTDESDKWAVSVLHELLNLFVGKKAERDSLLYLGEHLGLRSRFKLAFLQHPGIFYVSSKIRTHTVVLKEGYKRGMLIDRHSLNDMRFKYVQLMNVETDEEKSKETKKKTVKKNSEGKELENGEEDVAGKESEDDQEEDDDDDEMYDSSDDEDEDESEEDDEGFEGENDGKRGGLKRRGENFEESDRRRNVGKRTNGEMYGKKSYGRGFEGENGGERGGYTRKGENIGVNDSRQNVGGRGNGRMYERNSYGDGENRSKRGGFNRRGESFEENDSRRNTGNRTNGRMYEKRNYGLRFEGQNVTSRGRFRGKGESFEESDSKRNVGRTNGRTYEKNNYGKGFESENGSQRGGFKSRGGDYEENNSRRNVGRTYGRTYEKKNYGKGFEGENGSKRGGYKSRGADYEGNNSGKNGARRTYGRSEENGYKSSSKFSKRTNVRNGEPDIPRLRTKKPDFSGNQAGV
ncbi:hypothetical protein CASFOL_016330 [Castilleja foliolosa]|uniref:PORR domain-containing protein n=1 Tax=Castilleja foliolosa TaxID=1961234 RepID=A0ABD3DI68_9LAMI